MRPLKKLERVFDSIKSKCALACWLSDRHGKRADSLDLAVELVAGNGRRHARRCAGHDDVACGELDHLAELDDHLRHVPDHLREVAVLAHLSIDAERDATLPRMPDLRSGL